MPGTSDGHWSDWSDSEPYTLGIEEEVMLLDPENGWALAQRIDDVLPELSEAMGERVAGETHGSAVELSTDPHESLEAAAAQVAALRGSLSRQLAAHGLRTASAGTHPCAVWNEIRIAGGDRHQAVYGSMRELARREPTFALHVHIGVGDPESAIRLHNRLRGHLAMLLALSTNSPFWQGRDTGLASARIPIFQAFPRVGVPRHFVDYADYVETVDLLLRCGAFPEPTFLWWDLRPQPKLGTLELRVMDAQARPQATRALVALLQSLAHLELEEGFLATRRIGRPRDAGREPLHRLTGRDPRPPDRSSVRAAGPRRVASLRAHGGSAGARRRARLSQRAGDSERAGARVRCRRAAAGLPRARLALRAGGAAVERLLRAGARGPLRPEAAATAARARPCGEGNRTPRRLIKARREAPTGASAPRSTAKQGDAPVMPKQFALLLSAGALALGVAACGGSSPTSSTAGAGSTAAATSSSSAPAASSSSAAPSAPSSGGSSHLSIAANPGGALMFDKTSLAAKAGKVTITFTNKAPEGHNFTLTGPGGQSVGSTPTFHGGSKTLAVTLKPGKYTYICSVPGHAQGGMMGTLTVT